MDDSKKTAKLFFSIFSSDKELISKIIYSLSAHYGEIDFETPFLPFNQTRYYEKEFGDNLERKIFSVKKIINPLEAINIKIECMEMEEKGSEWGKRKFNIDPGYVELSHVILTTRKPYSHRIYVGKGVFADLTLIYKKEEGFVPLNWTYPDYGSQQYRDFFNKIRDILKINLREQKDAD